MKLSPLGIPAHVDVPVHVDPWLPEFTERHPSVQRWWSRVLCHLGENPRGDRVYYLVAGRVWVHPNNVRLVVQSLKKEG